VISLISHSLSEDQLTLVCYVVCSTPFRRDLISDALLKDTNFRREVAMRGCVGALDHVEVYEDQRFLERLFRRLSFSSFSPKHLDTEEIALALVSRNGLNLQRLFLRLKKTAKVIEAAVNQTPACYKVVDTEFRALAAGIAVKKNPGLVHESSPVLVVKDLVLSALKVDNGFNVEFRHLPIHLMNDLQVNLAALRRGADRSRVFGGLIEPETGSLPMKEVAHLARTKLAEDRFNKNTCVEAAQEWFEAFLEKQACLNSLVGRLPNEALILITNFSAMLPELGKLNVLLEWSPTLDEVARLFKQHWKHALHYI